MLYLFTNAFQYLHMGFASALAWMFVLMILVLVALQLFLGSRWVYYEGATQQ
jgi:multiple sugar transport system permease protein